MLLAGSATAQPQPPGRVGRLNHTEGRVLYLPAQGSDWTDAQLNRPLGRGDQLWADKGTRAEIQIGSAVLRLDGGTWLKVLALDDGSTQLSLTQGSLHMRVRSLPEGENFEVDTPNLAYRTAYPGEARIDVDAARGITRVTMRSGAGAVYGERAQALPLGGGQQMTFAQRSLAEVGAQDSPPPDNFDRWVSERMRREDQSLAARYLPRELVGYQWLDGNGQWGHDPTYGTVWFPNPQPTAWAPFRQGRWAWVAPWGWTWIDDAPWAFAPSHYGRWALVGARWAWVPGRLPLRPTYAPALVAFVGATGAATLTVAGKASVGWIPLAPGEPWQPDGRAASPYVDGVNANTRLLPATGHAYLRRPEALTTMAADDFVQGKSLRSGGPPAAVAPAAKLQVVPAPATPAIFAAARLQEAQHARITPARQEAPAPGTPQAGAQARPQPAKPQEPKAREAKAKVTASPTRTAKARTTESPRAAQQPRPPAPQRQARADPTRQASSNAASVQPASARRTATTTTTTTRKPAQDTHAQQVEAARQAAGREAQQLREQREATERRRAAEQERVRREALQRQQALGGGG